MATNVKGSFNVLREAARRTRNGRIVILASTSIKAKRATPGGYAATKAVQENYAGVLSEELADAAFPSTPWLRTDEQMPAGRPAADVRREAEGV